MPDADPLTAGLSLPAAARLQGDISAYDLVLAARAAMRRPCVLWWWGIRRADVGQAVATCYLCDAAVVTWSSRWPMTRTAVDAVLDHRDDAHSAAATYGTRAGSTMGPADAPEERSGS